MKRLVRFSRGFVPAAIASTAIIVLGIVGYLALGFNLGVDFQAGINETVQLAYPALEVTYSGKGNAVIEVSEKGLTVVFSGAEIQSRTLEVSFAERKTLGDVAAALRAEAELGVTARDAEGLASALFVPTFQGNTRLSPTPVLLHRAPAGAEERYAPADKVRAALSTLGDVSVQTVNPAELQRYIVRIQDEGKDPAFSKNAADSIRGALEGAFGKGRVVVLRTDYVGARYSESLGRQSAVLILLTSLVILAYAAIRFKLQYGIGAVIAILHDALVMVAFVTWTRMEFNTATIAAILTILGYSINDTIVQFDRVREDRRLRPTDKFVDVLDGALSETLGRTIITTTTTMLTVLALFFFTSGSIHDFALALFVGMVSGTYSTIFIASGFVAFWEKLAEKRRLRGLAAPAAGGVKA